MVPNGRVGRADRRRWSVGEAGKRRWMHSWEQYRTDVLACQVFALRVGKSGCKGKESRQARRPKTNSGSVDNRSPRWQCLVRTWSCQSDGIQSTCALCRPTVWASPKGPRYKLSCRRMQPNRIRRMLSSRRRSGLNQPGVGTSNPEIVLWRCKYEVAPSCGLTFLSFRSINA
jgi:hypothetical protein